MYGLKFYKERRRVAKIRQEKVVQWHDELNLDIPVENVLTLNIEGDDKRNEAYKEWFNKKRKVNL